ncbi:MAG: HEPN domain-containing protein [Candidatus Bathyarchaeia archaeon]
MRSMEMALDYIGRASRMLIEARNALNSGDYPLTVRRSQEVVELSLKAALRLLAVEYPREHDLRDVLMEAAESRELPQWFREELEFMGAVSSDLARKRGPAFYGDEMTLKPPSSLFSFEDALKALRDAERVHENCRCLIEQVRCGD